MLVIFSMCRTWLADLSCFCIWKRNLLVHYSTYIKLDHWLAYEACEPADISKGHDGGEWLWMFVYIVGWGLWSQVFLQKHRQARIGPIFNTYVEVQYTELQELRIIRAFTCTTCSCTYSLSDADTYSILEKVFKRTVSRGAVDFLQMSS